MDKEFSIYGKQILAYRNIIDKGYSLRGKDYFFRNSSENKSKKYRKSIWSVEKIEKGKTFNLKNIRRLRPGYGLSTIYFRKLLNKKSPYSISKNTPLNKNLIKKLNIKI